MPTKYRIDIIDEKLFIDDFKKMNEKFEIIGYPNGNIEVTFDVNKNTTKWMLENYTFMDICQISGKPFWSSEPLWFYME
tara:strand:- start:247 stop:483 length:237 start_codon:yes stop_codon:yes gene_type:complete